MYICDVIPNYSPLPALQTAPRKTSLSLVFKMKKKGVKKKVLNNFEEWEGTCLRGCVSSCVGVYVHACVCVSVRVCMRASVRACVRVCSLVCVIVFVGACVHRERKERGEKETESDFKPSFLFRLPTPLCLHTPFLSR